MNFRQKIQQVDICFNKSVTIYPQIHDLHFLYIKLGHLHIFTYKMNVVHIKFLHDTLKGQLFVNDVYG